MSAPVVSLSHAAASRGVDNSLRALNRAVRGGEEDVVHWAWATYLAVCRLDRIREAGA